MLVLAVLYEHSPALNLHPKLTSPSLSHRPSSTLRPSNRRPRIHRSSTLLVPRVHGPRGFGVRCPRNRRRQRVQGQEGTFPPLNPTTTLLPTPLSNRLTPLPDPRRLRRRLRPSNQHPPFPKNLHRPHRLHRNVSRRPPRLPLCP